MEKPILFNTEMVQAILEGRKTSTRRIIKPQPPKWIKQFGLTIFTPDERHISGRGNYNNEPAEKFIKMPYCKGDTLWVRETWKQADTYYGAQVGTKYIFKAGYKKENDIREETSWHPSIHMPREAARIFLKVTDVRVQRLQDITEDKAKTEGCLNVVGGCENCRGPAKHQFERIWGSTVNKKDLNKYGWSANPWVWIIEFQKED